MVIQCVHVHLYIEFIVNNYHIACRTELQRSLRVYVVYHMRYRLPAHARAPATSTCSSIKRVGLPELHKGS